MCLAVFFIIAPKQKSTQMAIKVNGHTNYSIFIQWSATQQIKGINTNRYNNMDEFSEALC